MLELYIVSIRSIMFGYTEISQTKSDSETTYTYKINKYKI